MPFSTYDYNLGSQGCALSGHGAWWYGTSVGCQWSNLNGHWGSSVALPSGINWYPWEYDLQTSAMKMRPAN